MNNQFKQDEFCKNREAKQRGRKKDGKGLLCFQNKNKKLFKRNCINSANHSWRMIVMGHLKLLNWFNISEHRDIFRTLHLVPSDELQVCLGCGLMPSCAAATSSCWDIGSNPGMVKIIEVHWSLQVQSSSSKPVTSCSWCVLHEGLSLSLAPSSGKRRQW